MASTPQIIIYCLIFCSAALAFQAMTGATRQFTANVKHANEKARRDEKAKSPEELLMEMRKDRGLTQDGTLKSINYYLGKLVLHSGLKLGSYGIYGLMAGGFVIGGGGLIVIKSALVWGIPGAIAGLLLPILVLKFFVKKRRNKAVEQLPEALDVIVRSLKAGHPVSVAMALVGREMPDPIGSEFGIASDEITFGRQVSTAIQRLSDRVGHEDFDLFAAMVRLQEKTGGNLAELLDANAKTIRDRQRMRMRIQAASSEGRASAYILNAAPIGMFFIIRLMAPDFYGDVEDHPAVKYGLMAVAFWMFLGNLVMRRMINFKI